MRHIYIILTSVLMLTAAMTSCSNDDIEPQEESIPVTYATMHGNWKLIELDGSPLADGLYMYMTIDRKEQSFVIYSNYKSPYTQRQSGTLTISGDEYSGYEVSGTYGVIAGDWAHTYIVNYIYPSGTMKWTSKDDEYDTQIFQKVEEIPAEIL